MLLVMFVTLVLFAIGAVIVARVAHAAMQRLGLELFDVLEWLGIAESQVDELSAWRGRRPRLGQPQLRA